MLVEHSSALELAGWRLQFSLPGAPFDQRATAAEQELDRYRAAGPDASAEPLRRSLAELERPA